MTEEDFKTSPGYQKLKKAVEKNIAEDVSRSGTHYCNFHPGGCAQPVSISKLCFHQYCDKFKWTIERVLHYSEKTGLPAAEILNAWEDQRTYWYMNYYQDCRQPLLDGSVRVFENIEELRDSVGDQGYRCPACHGISKNPYVCDTGLEMHPGKTCDWKAGGLFGCLGQGTTVFVKAVMRIETVFTPVAWEDKEVS